MAKVAFLGLGVMGFPMAGHLAAKGHDVMVYNRTFAKAEAWTKKHKGKAARTPRRPRPASEIVFCCVGNDDDLRSVVTGRRRRLRRHGQGHDLLRQHHRLGRHRARVPCAGQEARRRLRRRACVGRPGGRRERPAHRDVRRRAGAVRQGQAGRRRPSPRPSP